MRFDVVSGTMLVDPEKRVDGKAMLKSVPVGNATIAEGHHYLMDHFGVGTEVIPATVGVEEVCLRITSLCMSNTDKELTCQS